MKNHEEEPRQINFDGYKHRTKASYTTYHMAYEALQETVNLAAMVLKFF